MAQVPTTKGVAIYLVVLGFFACALFPPLGVAMIIWGGVIHRRHRKMLTGIKFYQARLEAERCQRRRYAAVSYLESLGR